MIWQLLARVRGRGIDRNLRDPQPVQERVLRKILGKLQGCELARTLGLEAVTSIDSFRRTVPITDYPFYQPYIRKILQGHEGILFPGKPAYIAQTGGTTAEPKRLPLSKALIRSYRQFNLDMAFCYMLDSGHADIFSGKIFLVAANPVAAHTEQGTPIGFITGVMAQIAPALLRYRYVPTLGVIRNPQMAEKIQQITQQGYAQRHKIRVAAGLTPYLMAAWRNLIDYSREQEGCYRRISEIFPRLRVAFHGGSTYNLYLDRMRELAGARVEHRNVYSAAEGPIAFQYTGGSPGLAPALDGVFFEFLSEAQLQHEHPRSLLVSEVECGIPYYILLTTQGGLLRYKIGDRVEFIHKDPPLFQVLGKSDDQIDLSAEKIGVDQAIRVLQETGHALGVKILNFLVCPAAGVPAERQIAHEWIIECEPIPADPTVFRDELERRLCQYNTMYRELRAHNFALAQPVITFVTGGTFQRYMEAEFNYGQQKLLHLRHDRTAAERLLYYAGTLQH